MTLRHIAVLDIGKTNAKLALVDLETASEIDVQTTENTVNAGPPYPQFDVAALWCFVIQALTELAGRERVDAISVTAHGAAAALLDAAGNLAAPILDYEYEGPDALRPRYDALRPSFAASGSPPLPAGLNLGAQIHWQLETVPGLRDRLAQVVTYPQFWSGRLSGSYRCEVTSLGCHTDLWLPGERRFSPLVDRLGLGRKMAPIAQARDVLGPLSPRVASETGLDPSIPVLCGIHDSNASLLPHLLDREAPFSVVSSGTWVIAMGIGAAPRRLEPQRDTLINVDATGAPVPSARFMGGRDRAVIGRDGLAEPTDAELAQVLGERIMLLPSVTRGCGPFPGQEARWAGADVALSPGLRQAALSFYLAMMISVCLEMIGAEGPILVEGPLAGDRHCLSMLRAVTGRPVLAAKDAERGAQTGTSLGAARLADRAGISAAADATAAPALPGPARAYGRAWREAAGRA